MESLMLRYIKGNIDRILPNMFCDSNSKNTNTLV
jgi:hypothetical protein